MASCELAIYRESNEQHARARREAMLIDEMPSIAGGTGGGNKSGSRGFPLPAVMAEGVQNTNNRQVSGANSKCDR